MEKSFANFRRREAVEGVWAASLISSQVQPSLRAIDLYGIPENASVSKAFNGIMRLGNGFTLGT